MKQNIYIVALLAGMLALAGCGGGSSSAPPVDPAAKAAEMKIDEANTAVDKLTATSSDDDVAAAKGKVEDAEAAIGKAPEDDRDDLHAKLAGAKENIRLRQANSRLAGEVSDLEQLEGMDNRTQAQIDAANKKLCEDGGGMLDTAGECKPDTSAADAAANNAIAEKLKGFALLSVMTAEQAEDQDNSEPKGSISMEGEAFNKAGLTGWSDATNKLTITANATAKHDAESSEFGAGEKVKLEANKPNIEGKKIWEDDGKYQGVSGKFSCDYTGGGDCVVRYVPSSGDVLFIQGMWTFTPDNPASKVTVDDIVTFGFWSDETPGHAMYDLGLYTSRDRRMGYVYSGTGTATFKGTAVGYYSVGEGNDATHDDFEATAELTATFSAAAMADRLKGTIKADNWSVELQAAEIDDARGIAEAGKTVWTLGGVKGDAGGGWQAGLYEIKDGGLMETDDFPEYTAGEFTAEHGLTGFMIGAFAAELE